jgi:hypothetical protein
LFASAVFTASILYPAISLKDSNLSAWAVLVRAPGVHYWLIPTIAFAWVSAWFLFGENRPRWSKTVGIFLLAVMSIGFSRDLRLPALPDTGFATAATEFDRSAPGTVKVFRQLPNGWSLILAKRSPHEQ